jgi:vacuolar-type H+-ATPase catalytic subunit A/Vma1
VRETVLGQSAYDPNDAYSPVEKTYRLAALAHGLYRAGLMALDRGTPIDRIDLTRGRNSLAAVRRSGPSDLEARIAEAEAAVAALGGGG